MKKINLLVIACLFFGISLSAQTVVDIIVNSPDHNTLEAAVIAAELDDDLSGEGPFTVFAPTDDAFAALPAGTVETLLMDPTGDLANILLYHVVGANVLSTDLADGMTATTLLGEDVMVTINTDGVFINDAQVIVADVEADNGVVHVIDAVLLPPTEPEANTVVDIIVNSPDHNTLEAAVIAAELDDDLSGEGPFTVFAPTDDAFAALPAGTVETLLMDPTGDLANILLYHVIGANVMSTDLADGMTATTLLGEDVMVTINTDGVFINNAQVIVADVEADNGVVHVIDAVLLPPAEPEANTVVDIIVNSPDHNTLEAAVIAAELDDDLSGDGPFTVFAPTDDAFAVLPAGTVETLLMDPTGDLANILLYHVLGANVLSTDLADGMTATTLLGEDVMVTINTDGVFINEAQVIVADVEADNGVVHVIDAVLLPPAEPVPSGTARVQVIHNAESETVQILANGEVFIPFLANKMVTPYVDVPAGVDLELVLEPTNFWSTASSVSTTVNFESGKTYQVVASGTFDESDAFPVRIDAFDAAIETTTANQVALQFFHGSYDAPTVDIVVGGAPLFDNVSYGSFGAEFISVPSNDTYRLVVTPGDDNNNIVAQYDLFMDWWKGNTATIFATGSLMDGTFQPWVALSRGGAYPLFPAQMGRPNAMSLRQALESAADLQAVQVYPNPAKYETTIDYTLDETSNTSIRLYDLSGKIMEEISYNQQQAGNYKELISTEQYDTGMYYILISINDRNQTIPLLIVD